MVNQTTELLIGISNQTGIQFNEILNMMSTYYIYRNIMDIICLFVILIVMCFSVIKIYRYLNDKHKDDVWFDKMDLFFYTLIPNIFVFLGVTFSVIIIENALLGIFFPKETIIYNMIQNLI